MLVIFKFFPLGFVDPLMPIPIVLAISLQEVAEIGQSLSLYYYLNYYSLYRGDVCYSPTAEMLRSN